MRIVNRCSSDERASTKLQMELNSRSGNPLKMIVIKAGHRDEFSMWALKKALYDSQSSRSTGGGNCTRDTLGILTKIDSAV